MLRLADLEFHPLTPDRWRDFEKLFGPKGACGGCWCMWWRLTNKDFSRQKGEANKNALKHLVDSGEATGILAYCGDKPVGWCSVAPRAAFPRLARSRVLKQVDDQPVWSVVCFFVAKQHRRQGVTVALLKAAVDYAGKQGASTVEGYPVETRSCEIADIFAYTGLVSAFRKVGFVELRRSPTRPIMRYIIPDTTKSVT